MATTQENARDQMCGIVNDALSDASFSGKILWSDVEGLPDQDTSEPWVKTTVRHADGQQTSLSSADRPRRFTSKGVIIIEIHSPVGDGYVTVDALATIIKNKYRTSRSGEGVWFRNVVSKEIGTVGAWTQTNVLVDFEYDEIV